MAALADSHDEAWEAMRVMSESAAELGMPLGADKSAVMSFEEGFSFIGEDFGPRYPPALADHRVTEPAHRVLYLAMQGAHARLESGRIIVESRGSKRSHADRRIETLVTVRERPTSDLYVPNEVTPAGV